MEAATAVRVASCGFASSSTSSASSSSRLRLRQPQPARAAAVVGVRQQKRLSALRKDGAYPEGAMDLACAAPVHPPTPSAAPARAALDTMVPLLTTTQHTGRPASHFRTVDGVRVVCGSRGCRPVLDDEEFLESELEAEALPDVDQDAGLAFSRNMFAVAAKQGNDEAWYKRQLARAPRDPTLLASYAHYVWKSLGNTAKADALYQCALKEAPTNAAILASYTHFLFRSES